MSDDSKKYSEAPQGDATGETVENQYSYPPASTIYSAIGYGGDYSAPRERSLRDYPIVLFRYWALILAFTVIGAGLAMYQTARTPKLYRSTALLNIGTYVPPLDGPTGNLLREETHSRTYANTQIRLLTSYTIAEEVLANNQAVRRYFGVKTKPGQAIPVSLLQSYLGHVNFRALPDTSLVEIYATTNSAPLAALIANSHARAFIDLVKKRHKQAANVNLKFLQERYKESTDKLQALERKRIRFAEKHAISLSNDASQQRVFSDKYQQIVRHLGSVMAARTSSEAHYREMKRTQGRGLQSDGKPNSLQIKLYQLEGEYESLRRHHGSRQNNVTRYLKDQIRQVESSLNKAGKLRVKEARNSYIASVQQEGFLKNELERLNEEQLDMSKHRVEHDRLMQEVVSAREVQKTLANRLEDAVINAQSNQETVALVDQAFPARGHISPDEWSNFMTGCFVGWLIGVFLAFVLDHLDTRVRSVGDLQHAVKAPVLGVIPEFLSNGKRRRMPRVFSASKASYYSDEEAVGAQGQESKVAQMNVLPIVAPYSAATESFRAVLATLTTSLPQFTSKIILVTSGQKGDGKTTLSVNLAASLAQIGERTLLVDADMRLPTIHRYFGVEDENNTGLTGYISGDFDPTEVIIETDIEDLAVLPAGQPVSNPAALLRSQRMSELLVMMSEEFDYIIIDSPPVGPVADALLLSRYADGVAVVVRSGETSSSVAGSAVSRLRQVGANVLGLVLNHSVSGDNYWRDAYRSGYGGGSTYSHTRNE